MDHTLKTAAEEPESMLLLGSPNFIKPASKLLKKKNLVTLVEDGEADFSKDHHHGCRAHFIGVLQWRKEFGSTLNPARASGDV